MLRNLFIILSFWGHMKEIEQILNYEDLSISKILKKIVTTLKLEGVVSLKDSVSFEQFKEILNFLFSRFMPYIVAYYFR
jgi:hypothetical protein